MIDVNQLRRGVSFENNDNLYKVTEYSHSKPGRGKATIKVNVRDMRTEREFAVDLYIWRPRARCSVGKTAVSIPV